MLHVLTTQLKGKIRGLAVDTIKNYVFTGGFDDGEIGIFDIVKPGSVLKYSKFTIKLLIKIQEKFAKENASLRGKTKVRYVEWSGSRGEIFVGNADGTSK